MMMNAQKKDPKLVAQIQEMIESGMDPQKIAETLMKEAAREKDPSVVEEEREIFSDEIIIASQALAYRDAMENDVKVIVQIINSAYDVEVKGKEAFRAGPGTVTEDLVKALLGSDEYNWILLEVPRGMNIESDGAVLGVCCFSTDGVSRKNGEVEGKLGSIRFFAVIPRYHGVLLGHRFLKKVESVMAAASCCRVMACIPDCRQRLLDWLLHSDRGYEALGSIPYPQLLPGHTLIHSKRNTVLVMLGKTLNNCKHKKAKKTTDAKNSHEVNPSQCQDIDVLKQICKQNKPSDSSDVFLPSPVRNSHLPPHWRGVNTSANSDENTS